MTDKTEKYGRNSSMERLLEEVKADNKERAIKIKIKQLNDNLFTTSVSSGFDSVFDKHYIESVITIGSSKLTVSVELEDFSDEELENAFGKITRGFSRRLEGLTDVNDSSPTITPEQTVDEEKKAALEAFERGTDFKNPLDDICRTYKFSAKDIKKIRKLLK